MSKIIAKILIIDDNDSYREAIAEQLSDLDFSVSQASNGREGLTIVADERFDLIITDMVMPEVGGIEVIKEAGRISPSSEVIVVTAYATLETAVNAIKLGAYDYVIKETPFEELKLTVDRALERKELIRKASAFEKEIKEKYSFDDIFGKSPAMLDVLNLLSKVSKTDSTVLVLGESGTGKELIGKAIHFNSNRKDKELVIINCGAIPENLQESELFGHKKGSFTGANSDKTGLIEEADGGTLILDEVGELSLQAQVKLLRFLQNNEIRMVGDTKTKFVDVRVIAMTNRKLEKEVEENKFREDLYYRLNVIPVNVPLLKNRRSDIQILAEHFKDKLKVKLNKPELSLSRRSVKLLENYSWPGNVRELENVLERCAILCEENTITPADLPYEISGISHELHSDDPSSLNLAEMEKKLISAAMENNSGNVSKASIDLGISRTTLISKLKKLGIK